MPIDSNRLFLIIGAQRSGTTYLCKLLEEHPEVCLAKPLKPEPKFFLNNEYYKGINFYFDKYFPHRKDKHNVFIEKSTSYYESKILPNRLINEFKNTNLIFLLRDPVERAISNYFFSYENGLENRTLEEVFILEKKEPVYNNKISTNPFDYIERGKYIIYLKMLLKNISMNNIHIITFNDITKRLDALQDLFRKLEIDQAFIPLKFGKVVNESVYKIKVPKIIIEKLEKIFTPFNIQLEDFLGRSLF